MIKKKIGLILIFDIHFLSFFFNNEHLKGTQVHMKKIKAALNHGNLHHGKQTNK